MDILQTFYETEVMREAVKAFMIDTLKTKTLENVYDNKSITGHFEAMQNIEDTFSKLEEMFGKDKGTTQENSR